MNGPWMRRSAWGLSLLLCFVATNGMGQEQDNKGYLSVNGRGEVSAAPNVLELRGTISSSGELASDAMTTFATAKEDALAALKELDIDGMTVETSGLNVGTAAAAGANPFIRIQQAQGAPAPPEVSVSESVIVRLEGIDKLDTQQLLGTMTKVVDAAKEAGISFGADLTTMSMSSYARSGMPSFTTYRLANVEALREQATEQAMKAAQDRAARLAKLAGGRAGKIRMVMETQNRSYTYGPSGAQLQGETSAVRQPIAVQVSMTVQFELLW